MSETTTAEKPHKADPKETDHERQSEQDGRDRDAHLDDEHPDRARQRKRARPFVWGGLAVFAVVLIGGGLWYYFSTRNEVTTDDAYTDGYAVQVAPQVSGKVVSLDVTDNEFVHKGQALIHIDARDYIDARDQAEGALAIAQGQLTGYRYGAEIAQKNFPAQLEAAKAQLVSAEATQYRAQKDDDRQHELPRGATTQQAVDNADATLRSANADVELAKARVQQAEPVPQNIGQAQSQVTRVEGTVKQAQAQFAQAELNLSRTVVHAPFDGWVTKRAVDVGTYVQPGQQIMSLVSPEIWITANLKETQLTRIRPGEPVRIAVDAYPSLKLRGHVDSIQMGSGAEFSAFPPENATGNFVKIVRRVPVKIDLDNVDGHSPPPLPLGVSVDPTVDVAGAK